MKKIIAIQILILATATVFGQAFQSDQYSFKFGEASSQKKNNISLLVVDNDNYFSFNQEKGDLHLKKYNQQLQVEGDITLQDGAIERKSFVENVLAYDGKLVLFYSTFDNASNINTLQYSVVNQDDLSVEKSGEQVLQVDYCKRSIMWYYEVSFSPDSSQIVAAANTLVSPMDDDERLLTVSVLNRNLENQWTSEVEISEKPFVLESCKVNNEGDVYILGRETTHGSKKQFDLTKSKCKMLGITDEGQTVSSADIWQDDKFILRCDFAFSGDKALVVTGVYSDEIFGQTSGTFFHRYDTETLVVLAESNNDFDDDLLIEGLPEARKEKLQKRLDKGYNLGMEHFKIRSVIPSSTGGVILVAENHYNYTQTIEVSVNGSEEIKTDTKKYYMGTYYHTESSSTRSRATSDATNSRRSNNHYLYGDILIVSYDKDGNILWTNIIRKYQPSRDDGAYKSGYLMTMTEDKMNFFYVIAGGLVFDLNIDKSKDKTAWKSLHFIHTSVTMTGERQSQSMGMISKKDMTPLPQYFAKAEDGRVMIYLSDFKENKLGVLKPQ